MKLGIILHEELQSKGQPIAICISQLQQNVGLKEALTWVEADINLEESEPHKSKPQKSLGPQET